MDTDPNGKTYPLYF